MRQALAGIQQRLPAHRGRVVHPEDLHITLVFLGPVEAERLDCVEQAAERISAASFELNIDHTGLFTRSRILWCGPTETPSALVDLVRGLQRNLGPCGFEPERRPYRAHVTLVRDARIVPTGPLERLLTWRCDHFALVESLSGGDPPRYRVIREWGLGRKTDS